MSATEQAVRDAAAKLHAALSDAHKAGLAVTWPLTCAGLLSISISETKRAIPEGQPLNLTDDERAALPPLDPNAVDDPATYIAVQGKGKVKA